MEAGQTTEKGMLKKTTCLVLPRTLPSTIHFLDVNQYAGQPR